MHLYLILACSEVSFYITFTLKLTRYQNCKIVSSIEVDRKFDKAFLGLNLPVNLSLFIPRYLSHELTSTYQQPSPNYRANKLASLLHLYN